MYKRSFSAFSGSLHWANAKPEVSIHTLARVYLNAFLVMPLNSIILLWPLIKKIKSDPKAHTSTAKTLNLGAQQKKKT